VGEYQKIYVNDSAAKFRSSEDLADTFRLKILYFRNYIEIIAITANLNNCKLTQ
jgi:hypothetical protein